MFSWLLFGRADKCLPQDCKFKSRQYYRYLWLGIKRIKLASSLSGLVLFLFRSISDTVKPFIHLIVVFFILLFIHIITYFCPQVFSIKLPILLELTERVEMNIITKYNSLLSNIHYAFMNEWVNSDYFAICHVIMCYFCQLIRLTVLCKYVGIHGYLSLKRMR